MPNISTKNSDAVVPEPLEQVDDARPGAERQGDARRARRA
jgi:hypothetical protein